MIYHNMGNGWTLATSSAEKTSNNATIRGIGMFLSPMANRSLLNVELISSQIMITTCNGNPNLTVVSCYSPTNCSDEEDDQEFYDQLTELIKRVPKHNLLLIDGDMNVKINTEDCKGDNLHINTNRNGEFLLNLITECALVNLATNYCKLKGQLWTFTCPAGAKAQIDHILINRKWRNSAIDCRSYNTYSSLAFDHSPCTAKIRLSPRADKSNKKRRIKHN